MFAKIKTKLKAAAGKGDGLEPESPAFQALLDGLKQTHSSFSRLSKVTKSLYTGEPNAQNQAEQFLNDEIKPVLKQEKSFQNLRIDLSVSIEGVQGAEKKGGSKLQAAQDKKNQSQQAYEAGRQQLQQSIEALDAKKDGVYQSIVASLCELLQGLRPSWGEPLPDAGKKPASAAATAAAAFSEQPEEVDQEEEQDDEQQWSAEVAQADDYGQQDAQLQDQHVEENQQAEEEETEEDEVQTDEESGSGQAFDGSGASFDPEPQQQQAAGPGRLMKAMHSHTAEGDDELSIEPGDILEVLDNTTEGWWTGLNQRTGCKGLFPTNYCTDV